MTEEVTAIDLSAASTADLIEEIETREDDETLEFRQQAIEAFLEEQAANGQVLVDLDELEKLNDLLWTDPASFPEQMRAWLRKTTGRF